MEPENVVESLEENSTELAEQVDFRPAIVIDDSDQFPEVSVSDLADFESMLEEPNAAMLKRLAMKPDLTHLDEAIGLVEDDRGNPILVPLFDVGDKIVIERYCSLLTGNPWLDTQTYTVCEINDNTGDLKLWNVEVCQWARGNYIDGPARGDVYKLPSNDLEIFGKKSRGRPRQRKIQSDQMNSGPKKRGRPKGSKNRSKEVL